MPHDSECFRAPGPPLGGVPHEADLAFASLRRSAGTREEERATLTGHATVLQDIAEATLAHWDAPAATHGTESLSYGELETAANQLAHRLLSRGLMPGAPVAVRLAPSLDVLVALLAVLKAGGVYVPVDPAQPEAFVLAILRDVAPTFLVTQDCLPAPPEGAAPSTLFLERERLLAQREPSSAPAAGRTPADPSHIFYTSGTTGKPKGVVASHGNLAYYLRSARQAYAFGPEDRFSALARYTFSISLFELLSPLTCGASVRLLHRDDVLAPDRLAARLHEITVLHAGPSLLGGLFAYLRGNPAAPRAFPRMRHASSGGDLVGPSIQEEMKKVFPNAETFVIYGCTEVSCMGCTHEISRLKTAATTLVGRPFPEVSLRLLDEAQRPVPAGAVGEICLAGPGVAIGYHGLPTLTQERFTSLDDARYYRTGDLGRLHPDGSLEILGRSDFQIQVRGIRVEATGIESTIRRLELAAQCAAVLTRAPDERLVAFVVSPKVRDFRAFRQALSQELPDYMLPQTMVVLEAMPLTPNGKVDRRALQTWDLTVRDAGPPVPEGPSRVPTPHPATPIEQVIAAAFSHVLHVKEVGLDDDFFALGGHSLLAFVLAQELENRLGVSLPPGIVFERPTVRALAAHTDSSLVPEQRPLLLSARGDLPPVFMLLGVHVYRQLAHELRDHYSAFAVYAGSEIAMLGPGAPSPRVADLAREYVSIVRRQQPHGPYRLIGMSFGGVLAYEVSRQLRTAGESTLFLGLIDSVLPESVYPRALAIATTRPLGLLRALFSRVRRRLSARLGAKPFSDFVEYPSDPRLAALEEMRQRAYHHAASDYARTIASTPTDLTLVIAGRRLARDPLQNPTGGWRPHARGLQVHLVDSDHLGLVELPAVTEVAQRFLARLQQADEVYLNGPPDLLERPVPSSPHTASPSSVPMEIH